MHRTSSRTRMFPVSLLLLGLLASVASAQQDFTEMMADFDFSQPSSMSFGSIVDIPTLANPSFNLDVTVPVIPMVSPEVASVVDVQLFVPPSIAMSDPFTSSPAMFTEPQAAVLTEPQITALTDPAVAMATQSASAMWQIQAEMTQLQQEVQQFNQFSQFADLSSSFQAARQAQDFADSQQKMMALAYAVGVELPR